MLSNESCEVSSFTNASSVFVSRDISSKYCQLSTMFEYSYKIILRKNYVSPVNIANAIAISRDVKMNFI